ncbi:MAG: hypothetical protein HFH68_14470 [Lachnospiraceae bacterium]|nr:hypothetical protein [Lachnospiraceae bacterium]
MNTIIPSKRKNETITIRCTSHEKDVIKEKANKHGKTVSAYLTDAGMAGRERHMSKDRRMARNLVEFIQCLDDCYGYIHSGNIETEVLEVMFNRIMEGAGKLWENL